MASLPAPPLMKSLPFEPMMLLAPALPVVTSRNCRAPEAVEVLEVDLREGIQARRRSRPPGRSIEAQIDPHHVVARDDPTEDQRVAARPGIDGIHVAGSDQHGDPIVARTSVDAILTQAAVQRVVAIAAVQRARCPGHLVMASLPAPPLMKSLPFEPMMLLAPALPR